MTDELTQLREENAALRAETQELRGCARGRKACDTQIDDLEAKVEQQRRERNSLKEQLDAARASEARLAEALAYYANPIISFNTRDETCAEHHCKAPGVVSEDLSRTDIMTEKELGAHARAALAAAPNAVALAESIRGVADAAAALGSEPHDVHRVQCALEAYRKARGEGK